MASKLSIEKAAQVWCRPECSHIEMDVVLAGAFAEVLDEIWTKPWLGNATTGEMLNEIAARVDVNYKTTGDNEIKGLPCPVSHNEQKLLNALLGLVGVTNRKEVIEMLHACEMAQGAPDIKNPAIVAIKTLLEVLPE